ncbi:hypothetical protein GCM10010404_91870 [Nonomuraea africana]
MLAAHTALVRATYAAQEVMSQAVLFNQSWDEEHVTARFCFELPPEIRFSLFSRTQEGRVGADFIWWFVDEQAAFGCLTQAKKLRCSGGVWRIGTDSPRKTLAQMRRLHAVADILNIPASYVFYAGDARYRSSMLCDKNHHGPLCTVRDGAAVTFLPTLIPEATVRAEAQFGDRHDRCRWLTTTGAIDAFHEAVPISWLVDPTAWRKNTSRRCATYRSLGLEHGHELLDFLTTEQTGARGIARSVLEIIAGIAITQFATITMEPDASPHEVGASDAPTFVSYPDTRGHFSRPYYRFVLRGLRHRAPDYVERCLSGDVPSFVSTNADGLIVVDLTPEKLMH